MADNLGFNSLVVSAGKLKPPVGFRKSHFVRKIHPAPNIYLSALRIERINQLICLAEQKNLLNLFNP